MFVSLLWVAPATLAVLDRIAQARISHEHPPTSQDLAWAAGDWLVYSFLTPVIFGVANRWPIVRPHFGRRIVVHLGISLLFCVAWAVGGTLLQLGLGLLFRPEEVHRLIEQAHGHFG